MRKLILASVAGLVMALVAMTFLVVGQTHPARADGLGVSTFNDIPVTGTSPQGTFTGNFTVAMFMVQDGQLMAQGNLTGTLDNILSNPTSPVSSSIPVNVQVALPVSVEANGLNLTVNLGPANVSAAGTTINLTAAIVSIDAQSGSPLAGLIGNITQLQNSNLPQLSTLLNLILALVG